MAKVRTFSRYFPADHLNAGQPTFFIEQMIEWFLENVNHRYHNVEVMLKELNPTLPIEILDEFYTTITPDIFTFKSHTIREGNSINNGELISPRVWSGKPYQTKQIIFLPPIKVRVWSAQIKDKCTSVIINGHRQNITTVAWKDGLCAQDFIQWFEKKNLNGQVICWNDKVTY